MVVSMDDTLGLVNSLQFWNTNGGVQFGDGTEGGRWWSVEDLGDGASVVRSREDGSAREIWVLRVGEGENGDCTSTKGRQYSVYVNTT